MGTPNERSEGLSTGRKQEGCRPMLGERDKKEGKRLEKTTNTLRERKRVFGRPQKKRLAQRKKKIIKKTRPLSGGLGGRDCAKRGDGNFESRATSQRASTWYHGG